MSSRLVLDSMSTQISLDSTRPLVWYRDVAHLHLKKVSLVPHPVHISVVISSIHLPRLLLPQLFACSLRRLSRHSPPTDSSSSRATRPPSATPSPPIRTTIRALRIRIRRRVPLLSPAIPLFNLAIPPSSSLPIPLKMLLLASMLTIRLSRRRSVTLCKSPRACILLTR